MLLQTLFIHPLLLIVLPIISVLNQKQFPLQKTSFTNTKFGLQQIFCFIKRIEIVLLDFMKVMTLSDVLLHQRHQILSIILTNHEIISIFTRDSQYLAIALIDQFLLSLSLSNTKISENKQISYYSISALIIATKFIRNDKPHLKKILKALQNHLLLKQSFQIQLLLITEQQILETIDYNIPQTTCYLILQNHIKSQKISANRKQTQIKTTIKLLKEISLLTFQLSQHPEIAKQLYQLVQTKKSTERAKKLYTLVLCSLKEKNQTKK